MQGNKDHIILEHLQWTMGYEVQITAANRLGYSEPTVYEFSMPPKPNIIKGKQDDFLSENWYYLIILLLWYISLVMNIKLDELKCHFYFLNIIVACRNEVSQFLA